MTNKDKEDCKCAPGTKYEDGSCFTVKQLLKLATEYNNKKTGKTINLVEDKKYLLRILIKYMEEDFNCKNQQCWINTLTRDDSEMANVFRPPGPNKGNAWLSTSDIDKVLKQYTRKYPDFEYLNAVPMDFETIPFCKEPTMKGMSYCKPGNIDLDSLYDSGKRKLGMVVNLDKHNQSGSHWVAVYADLDNNRVYFFDSYGFKPTKEVKKYMNKLVKFIKKKKGLNDVPSVNSDNVLNIKSDNIDVRYNKTKHQNENSECGVYSINFILRNLKGENMDDFDWKMTDDRVNKCRNVYFREPLLGT